MATRLRQRIEAVLDYAAVHEDDQDRGNPARWKGVLDKVLPRARKVTKKIHHAAAPCADVPAIMMALRKKISLSAYCLKFTILTAARSGEARGALWSEIDVKTRAWTVPAERMKAERRAELMNAWGRYCASAGNVVQPLATESKVLDTH
jgi:integrase